MELMDFGPRHLPPALFAHAHVPLWEPEWGTMYRTLPVTFPTDKAAGGQIIARLPLMADGLVHLDTDPAIKAIAAYPMTIEYFSPRRNNTSVKREHVPDVAVLRADGSVVFIDYVPVNEQAEKAWIAKRTQVLRAHIEAHHGCSYAVHDELCLLAKPLFPNLKTMWAHKPGPLDLPEAQLVIRAVRRHRFPSMLGTLKRALHADPDLMSVFRRIDVDGVDLAFTAVMQMCFLGELDIDLSKPFSPTTGVFALNLRGA